MSARNLLPVKTFLASLSLLAMLSPVHAAAGGTGGMVPLSAKVSHVIHIVVDGLRADSLLNAGHPAFDYLLHTGACTLNARHDDASSQTLPNHIGMFTGLPVADHGYAEDKDYGPVNATAAATSNTTTTGTAATASQPHSTLIDTETGQPFQSIFDIVDSSRSSGTTNGRTAIFTSKSKFQLFDRTWPVSSYYENKKSKAVTRRFINEMSNKHFAYSYLHVVDPDLNGHRYDGAATPQYANGVATASYRLGEVFDMISAHPILADDTALIVTADHGFSDYGNHADGDDPDVYHIPFCAWGPPGRNVVTPHGNLYGMNRDNGSGLANPANRKARGERVVRNTYAAPLAADLLGIHPAEGALGDQYMAISDGSSTEPVLSWLEWKAAHRDDYDWSEPAEVEMDEAEELLLAASTDEEEEVVETAPSPEIVVPIEEVSKEEAQEEEETKDVPLPIDAEETIIDTEDIPVPMDFEESINTEEIPVPIDIEEVDNTEDVPVPMDEEEEEVPAVLIPPTEVSEDMAKANALPSEDDVPVDTVEKVDVDAKDKSSDTRGAQEQNDSGDSTSESQATIFQISEGGSFVACDWVVKKPELVEYRCGRSTVDGDVVKDICPDECAENDKDEEEEEVEDEDETGSGPDISAFITEDSSNVPSQESGRSGAEVGLIAASAVAVLALAIAVYIYTTTSKAKAKAKAEAETAEGAVLKKAGGSTAKLDETRVSISSGGSDDGTDNLFSGYASSSTFDEESCIDIGRSSSTNTEGRSFSRSSSSAAMHKSRSFTLDETASAHVKAIEAGAWPDDVVPFEAVEVSVTASKTVWHVVDLEK